MRVARSVLSVMLLLERHQEIHVEGVKSRAMAHNSNFSIEQTCNVVGP